MFAKHLETYNNVCNHSHPYGQILLDLFLDPDRDQVLYQQISRHVSGQRRWGMGVSLKQVSINLLDCLDGGIPSLLAKSQWFWSNFLKQSVGPADRNSYFLFLQKCLQVAPDAFLRDKEFMTKIMEKGDELEQNVFYLLCFTSSFVLYFDDDLNLIAFAGPSNYVRMELQNMADKNFIGTPAYYMGFRDRIRVNLDTYDAFHNVVVHALESASASLDIPNSPEPIDIALLNQGPATMSHYIELIGKFLGTPNTKKLERMRRVDDNLDKFYHLLKRRNNAGAPARPLRRNRDSFFDHVIERLGLGDDDNIPESPQAPLNRRGPRRACFRR